MSEIRTAREIALGLVAERRAAKSEANRLKFDADQKERELTREAINIVLTTLDQFRCDFDVRVSNAQGGGWAVFDPQGTNQLGAVFIHVDQTSWSIHMVDRAIGVPGRAVDNHHKSEVASTFGMFMAGLYMAEPEKSK
jgi:hypothetical protein